MNYLLESEPRNSEISVSIFGLFITTTDKLSLQKFFHLFSMFSTQTANLEKVKPVDYKLFQVADLVCTMELLSEKAENRSFSKSETEFFCSIRDFRKNYLKPLQKKKL